jgi:hypothetical protein
MKKIISTDIRNPNHFGQREASKFATSGDMGEVDVTPSPSPRGRGQVRTDFVAASPRSVFGSCESARCTLEPSSYRNAVASFSARSHANRR